MKQALKKSISALLALTLLFSICPVFASATDIIASGYCGGKGDGTNLEWDLTGNGTLTISGIGFMGDINPWEDYRNSITELIIGDGVTSIGASAFYGCTSLTSVELPDSVAVIGPEAFYGCKSLTSIDIPNSTNTIGGYAFGCCTNLKNVSIGANVTTIGDSAFVECTSIVEVEIPNSVVSIGSAAFYKCTSLTSVSLPDSITNIDKKTFQSCSALTSITIPASVNSIGQMALDSLTDIYFEGNAPSVVSATSNYSSFNRRGNVTLYYIPGTAGWTDSDAYDAEAGTWNGYKLAVWESEFSDMTPSDKYYEAANYMVSNGIMAPIVGERFGPKYAAYRATLIYVLWQMENEPVVSYKMTFKDVPEGEWYTEAIQWAAANGIIKGISETKFSPMAEISKENLLTVLYRYEKYKSGNTSAGDNVQLQFSDASGISAYAVDAVKWACGMGIIENTAQTLLPRQAMIRGEFAQILMNSCERAAN